MNTRISLGCIDIPIKIFLWNVQQYLYILSPLLYDATAPRRSVVETRVVGSIPEAEHEILHRYDINILS